MARPSRILTRLPAANLVHLGAPGGTPDRSKNLYPGLAARVKDAKGELAVAVETAAPDPFLLADTASPNAVRELADTGRAARSTTAAGSPPLAMRSGRAWPVNCSTASTPPESRPRPDAI